MPQHGNPTLCESDNGKVSILSNGITYKLQFKNIMLILTSQQLHDLKRYLDQLDPEEWFSTPYEEFAFIYFKPLCASYFVSREDLDELLQLLLEAAAMVKVHQRLFFKTEKTRSN